MSLAFLALFCLCATVHLAACLCRRDALRRATKPPLMPLLACWYAVAAGASLWPAVVLALLCATAGDTLLLSHRGRGALFAAGTACFALGHGCYIFALLSRLSAPLPEPAVPLCAVGYAALTAASAAYFWPHLPRKAAPFCVLYMAILAGMSCCALLYALSGASGGWAVCAGSLLFLTSGALLTHTTFCTTAGEHRFSVMLTYLAAQGLMVAGFLGGF